MVSERGAGFERMLTLITVGIVQETKTDQFSAEPWVSRINESKTSVSKRRHYRLVTQTVGSSLSSVRGTEELLYATYDILLGMLY